MTPTIRSSLFTTLALTLASGCVSTVEDDGAGELDDQPLAAPAGVHIEPIPWTSAHAKPDHTKWGDNMRKIVRDGDDVYAYWIDNSAGSSGRSWMRIIRKHGDGPWQPLGLSFNTVRPGNLVVAPGCVHAFVFEPASFADRSEDRLGGLKHYYFASGTASPSAQSEWVVAPPGSRSEGETINMRIGASIAPDGRMAVAWGFHPGQMHIMTRDGGGCYGGGWSHRTVESGLQHTFYYPRVTVAGGSRPGDGPSQRYYTAVHAQMDEAVNPMCDGSANSESIYRKANYWEDSRNGNFRRETAINLWNPCSTTYDRVQNTEAYVDASSRTHLIFVKKKSGATRAIEHWIKPGDSFKSDPALSGGGTCSPSHPCHWTAKLSLDWASRDISQVRLFEANDPATGQWKLYYWANSGTRAYLAEFTGASLGADALVPITPASMPGLYGMRAFVANRGGGTKLSEPYFDAIMHGVGGSYYVRIAKEDLPGLLHPADIDGYLDRERYDGTDLLITGWACVPGSPELPSFEVWVTDGGHTERLPIRALARPRRADADARCGTAARHGYAIRVHKRVLTGHVGWRVQVYAAAAGAARAQLEEGHRYVPHTVTPVTNGYIDATRVRDGRAEVVGWACEKGVGPVRVHLYAGGRAGTGTKIGSVIADRAREDVGAKFDLCDSDSAARGFRFRLTPAQRAAHRGERAFVHVITPTGGVGNPTIKHSGWYAIP